MFSNAPQKMSFNGVSQKHTMNMQIDSGNVITRKILRDVWNKDNLQASINNHGRTLGPFRAANNLGDYLTRPYYVCGVPHEVVPRRQPGWRVRNAHSVCDGTGVAGASCNPRKVVDSSEFTIYRRQRAMLGTYNSISTGGHTAGTGGFMRSVSGRNARMFSTPAATTLA